MRNLPLHSGARGLEDDCAVLDIGSETLVLTHDAMAQDVHFRSDANLADVAWKLLASNLSDLAAKGAQPIGVLLSHSLGAHDDQFLSGLNAALVQFNTTLLGGDSITPTQGRSFAITAIGRATHRPVPSRSGATPGENVYITNCVGRAMLGFEGHPQHVQAFNRPQPRLAEGKALAPLVTAMMDISDGLLLDAFRLAQASQVTLAIDSALVPVADDGRRDDCMRWGDDYELLFTLPPGVQPTSPATCIGSAEPMGLAPLMVDDNPVVNSLGLGFQH